MVCLLLPLCTMGLSMAQERINEFVVNVDENHNPMTIYSSYGATPDDGVVIVNSTIPNLEFNIPAAPGRIRTIPDKKKNRYVLIIQPNDSNYKQYTITINAMGFKQGKIEEVVVKSAMSKGYIVNPINDMLSSKDLLAKITVCGRDGIPLTGAKLTNKTTGKFYFTDSDGIGVIPFENKGQTADVTVSHFSYVDTKDVIIQSGDNIKHTLFKYNPSKVNNTYNDAASMKDEERINAFLHNYNVFICKDLDLIEKMISEDALIVSGKVVNNNDDTRIEYSFSNKKEYMARLRGISARNKYINVEFDGVEIVQSKANLSIYGIRLNQYWHVAPTAKSKGYSDEGKLFLIIDFTNEDQPEILVKTWQPSRDLNGNPIRYTDEELFSIGDFNIE